MGWSGLPGKREADMRAGTTPIIFMFCFLSEIAEEMESGDSAGTIKIGKGFVYPT